MNRQLNRVALYLTGVAIGMGILFFKERNNPAPAAPSTVAFSVGNATFEFEPIPASAPPGQITVAGVSATQWNAVMGTQSAAAPEPGSPEVATFFDKLNGRHDGYHYRLPTEREVIPPAGPGFRVVREQVAP